MKTKTLLLFLIAFFCFSTAFGQTTDPFNTPGTGTWTAPFGVTSVTVEVWGAGGGGTGVGVLTTNGKNSAGGGGSGGGFVKTTYAVIPGTTYNFNVGAGGSGPSVADGEVSWFINATTIKAVGGKGAGAKISADNASGSGAIAPITGNIGGSSISSYGGNGANGVTGSAAGGGGSSAGNITGNSASGSTGGLPPTNGFAGATAPGSNGTAGNGTVGNPGGIGAGGSGAKKGTGVATPEGGNGGDGQIKITYTCPSFSAGANQTLTACATTATLAATAVSLPATGLWSVVSGSGSVTTPASATSGITGIVPGTPLVLKWTVTNGNCGSTFSDITITSPVGPACLTYCPPAHSISCDGIITNVTLNTINNNSGCGNPDGTSYTNYARLGTPTTSLLIGSTYNLSVTTDLLAIVSAWIDFNQNGIFETAEWVQIYTSGLTGTVNFLIPSGAKPGVTRIRIRSRITGNPNGSSESCTNFGSGETEDYAITLVTPVQCSGTPNGITTNLSLNTGTPTTVFVASVTGIPSNVSGLTYQWEIADSSTGPWTTIIGATTATSNLTADSVVANTKYYRLAIKCTNSGLTGFSTVQSFTTTGCTSPPTSTSTDRYISNVKFLGTLNPDTANPSVYSANGYNNYTGLSAKAKQIAGGGINVFISSTATAATEKINLTKAWVDWNKDGYYNDNTERVYTSGIVRLSSTTFGFIVPAGTLPGNYKTRLRIYYVPTSGPGSTDPTFFDACGSLSSGETEDYSFDVISACASIITATPKVLRCGTGAVTLSATASAGATGFKWYDSEYGGILLSSATTYSTANLDVGTYTYYVTATDATCESRKRTPVYVTVSPVPTVTFSPSEPSICGDVGSIIVGVSGDKEEVTIINENFESGLGVFTSGVLTDNGATVNARTQWQSKTSTFIPVESVWFPAIDSGSNKFAFATSDIATYTYNTTLTYNSTILNTAGFLNLNLSFDAYFSYYGAASEALYVEVFNNTSSTWVPVGTYNSSIGIGTHFLNRTVSIPSTYVGYTNLKLRFRYSAGWNDGVAIDNVRLSGDKPFATPFTFSSTASGQVFSAADCSSAVTSATSVCFKPDPTKLEQYETWTLTANATLKNGCVGTGSLTINNDNKFWNKPVATNDWKSSNWLPGIGVPDNTKCVIVKTPVILDATTNGFAKNIKIETKTGATGRLVIAGSLTVTDYVANTGTENDLIIESDANLKQINDIPLKPNVGTVTAKRNIKFRSNTSRDEYNYLISPLVGQSLKTLYPGVPTTAIYPYILYHNEANNFFYNSSGAYIPGRGLAVKEPSVADVPANNKDAEFKGPLANGVVTFPLAFTNSTHGYNLVGNPYASNIDLEALYTLNGPARITSTFYFWDNGANNIYVQQGSGYSGRAYAVYNAVTHTGNKAGYLLDPDPLQAIGTKKPNKITKVGQGFMVKTPSGSQTLNFNNSIRVVENTAVQFFSKASDSTVNRYWLRLISPTNAVNTMAVVYLENGSNGFGMDDSELNISSSDMLYSLVEGHQLQIEGKSTFGNTDRVILGSSYFSTGNYIIGIEEKEGIFANNQNIYLKDKQMGTLTNLSEGDYTFAATAGESTGRFEIIYKPETVLATDAPTNENLVVYKNGDDFVVKAQTKKIMGLELFDVTGRLMRSFSPNSLRVTIPADQLINGVYILKIHQKGAITTKKIIR